MCRNLFTGGLSCVTPEFRNRGIKKAPFIVLIGANMPSILAEISFVSNPADETETADCGTSPAHRGIALSGRLEVREWSEAGLKSPAEAPRTKAK